MKINKPLFENFYKQYHSTWPGSPERFEDLNYALQCTLVEEYNNLPESIEVKESK